GRKGLPVLDSLSFDYGIYKVRSNILERLNIAVRPANLDRLDFARGAQAKMQPQVILRQVAGSSAHFAELLYSSGPDVHPGANRSAIALCRDELEKDAMIPIGIHVLKQGRRLADIQEKNVDISGVEDVAKSGAAPGMERERGQTRLLGDFIKGSIAIIAVEENRLAVPGTGLQRVNLRIDMAVSDKEVQPGIVIHIKESRSPSNIRIAGPALSRGPTHIIEAPGAQIAVKRIGLLFKVSDKKAQAPTMIIIAKIHSHVSQFQAFTTQRDAREQSHISERSIVIVVIEIVRHGVIRNQEIGPAIVVVIGPYRAEAIVSDVIVYAGLH